MPRSQAQACEAALVVAVGECYSCSLLEQAVRLLEREAEPWIPVGALCDSLENVLGLGACLSKRVERKGEFLFFFETDFL